MAERGKNGRMMSRIIPEPRSLIDLVGTDALLPYTQVAALAGMHHKTFQKRIMNTGAIIYIRPSPRKLLIPTNQFTRDMVEEISLLARAISDYRASQVVYFIGAGEDGPIKIGIASDLDRRLFELQNQHWLELRVLGSCEGGLALERDLHRKFANHRLRGEWFTRSPDILAEIEALCVPNLTPAGLNHSMGGR